MLKGRSALMALGFLGIAVASAALSSACGAEKGAIMLAVTTDMKAPKDVSAVSVTISSNGAIKHSFIGRVTPQGEVLLPATLAIVEPDDPNASIRVRVIAFQERRPRVLRDVRTSIPRGGRTALLRLPLNFVNDGSTKSPDLPAGVLPEPFLGTGGGGSGGGGSTDGGSPIGGSGEVDFFTAFKPDCPDIENQTWIDGECRDSFVDPATLPDFADDQIGDPTNAAACFDVARCFGGASILSGEGTAPVTFDRNACSIQLNGADPSRLNLALVTNDTGECVKPGECYVPLDRNANGWVEEGSRISLPKYVCKLLTGKNLRLAVSSGTCAAKEEKSSFCVAPTPKPGDIDGGPVAQAAELLFPADYPAALGSTDAYARSNGAGSLYFAAADSVSCVDLFSSPLVARPFAGLTAAREPWRFNRGAPRQLANGSSASFTISGGDGNGCVGAGGTRVSGTVTFPAGNVAVGVEGAIAVRGPSPGLYSGLTGPATKIDFSANGPQDPTAVAGLAADAMGVRRLLVGEATGAVRSCPSGESTCTPARSLAPGPVDAIVSKPGSSVTAYALVPSGVHRLTISTGAIESAVLAAANAAGIDEGAKHYARGLSANDACVFFASEAGLEWARDDGARGTLVPANGRQVLDVHVASSMRDGSSKAVYFTIYGPRSAGGGIYRTPFPNQCPGASTGTPDAGAPVTPDGGP